MKEEKISLLCNYKLHITLEILLFISQDMPFRRQLIMRNRLHLASSRKKWSIAGRERRKIFIKHRMKYSLFATPDCDLQYSIAAVAFTAHLLFLSLSLVDMLFYEKHLFRHGQTRARIRESATIRHC